MSKSRVIFLGVALASAALAAFLVKDLVGKKPQQKIIEVNKVEKTKVLVMARDLSVGERLSGANMKWVDWPKDLVGSGMITISSRPKAMSKLKNTRARVALYKDEPVSERKLILETSNGFMAAMLPSGYRAISVRISAATGAGGFILPNDRVDVLVTRKDKFDGSSQPVTVSETVITNVRVLAVDQTYKTGDDGEQFAVSKTATLELTPEQAEVLAKVETSGQLTLALRALADAGSKKMGDDVPKLSPRYAKGSTGNEINIFRYGARSQTASTK